MDIPLNTHAILSTDAERCTTGFRITGLNSRRWNNLIVLFASCCVLAAFPGSVLAATNTVPTVTDKNDRSVREQAKKRAKPPIISAAVIGPTSITEGGLTTFSVTASAVSLTSVTVNYVMAGTAILGSQYTLTGVAGQVVIPAGSRSANVTLQATVTNVTTGSETAVFLLQAGSGYKLAKVKRKAPKPTVTIQNIAPVTITGVSDSAPTPLTPIIIATTGLNPNQPVTVNFFDGNGFSVSDQPIRIKSDGGVVAAVPVYVDPISKDIASRTVSLTLTQGGITSDPVSVNIQDLPSLDDYGVLPGEISHAALVLDATLLGRRLNQLQAAQALNPNVDTSGAQQTVSTLLRGALLARNDVDRVMLDNTTIISTGTLPSGVAVQFDVNSQIMMDRVLAIYLRSLAAAVTSSTNSADSVQPEKPWTQAARRAALSASGLKDFIDFLTDINFVAETAKTAQDVNKSEGLVDTSLSVAKGFNSFIEYTAGVVGKETVEKISAKIGGIFGVFDVIRDMGELAGDLGFVIVASHSGGDPAVLQEAVNDIDNVSTHLLFDSAGLALTAASLYLAEIEASVSIGGAVIQGLQFALTNVELIHDSGEDKGSYETGVELAEMMPVFSSPDDGFAEINGFADVTNDAGIAGVQNTIDLCCLGASDLDLQGIADPNGNYDLFVPLQVPGTNYNNLTLGIDDFITGNQIGSEVVDLTGLDTSQPVSLPTVTCTCFDDDALNPDDDDPDCD